MYNNFINIISTTLELLAPLIKFFNQKEKLFQKIVANKRAERNNHGKT